MEKLVDNISSKRKSKPVKEFRLIQLKTYDPQVIKIVDRLKEKAAWGETIRFWERAAIKEHARMKRPKRQQKQKKDERKRRGLFRR